MRKVVKASPVQQMVLILAMFAGLSGSLPGIALADDTWTYDEIDWVNDVTYVPFSVMQAVDANGNQTWTVPTLSGYDGYPQAYKLRGVVLNDPGKMLDSTANYVYNQPGALGGQWQVYIQAVDYTLYDDEPIELIGDHGGAALWMGQNYGNLKAFWGGEFRPEYSYHNEGYWENGQWHLGWEEELDRLNTARGWIDEPLRAGDLIEVRARTALDHAGKFNCNEQHRNGLSYDFDIVILDRDLPLEPASITLDEIIDGDGNFLVDGSSGLPVAEGHQSQYVTLKGVKIADASNWTTYGEITVTDDDLGTFVVKLGYNTAFATAFDIAALAAAEIELDITGIFDQEDSATPYTDNYRLWATSPADFVPATSLVPGDANGDNEVNADDDACLAQHWGMTDDASWFDGDFNGDQRVDAADAAILAANWGAGGAEQGPSPVPEPTVLAMLLAGLVATLGRSRRSGSA